MCLLQNKLSSPLAEWSCWLVFWGGRKRGHCCMVYLGAQALHRMGREPRSLPVRFVSDITFLQIVELQKPDTCMSSLCFLFLQVLTRFMSIFFSKYMPSWIFIMPSEATMQFSLQLLPPLWEDYTFQNALKYTFPKFTLAMLTEFPPWRLPGHRVSAFLCFSVAMSYFVFKMSHSTYPEI